MITTEDKQLCTCTGRGCIQLKTLHTSSNSLRNPHKTVTNNLIVFQSTRLEELAYAGRREFDDIL